MVDFSFIYQAGKDIVNYFMQRSKNKGKKIPIKKFIKLIEKKVKMKLSKNSKEELLSDMEQNGELKIVTSTTGQKYVLIGNVHP